ncbi:hypothetical protein ACWDOP_00385 [Nocardia sp. NPDC003693]
MPGMPEDAVPFTVPSVVRDSAAFMKMMREMHAGSGRTAGQIAAFARMPRSTAYRFIQADNDTLPKSRGQVERFAEGCRLGPDQVEAVLRHWDLLTEEEAEGPVPQAEGTLLQIVTGYKAEHSNNAAAADGDGDGDGAASTGDEKSETFKSTRRRRAYEYGGYWGVDRATVLLVAALGLLVLQHVHVGPFSTTTTTGTLEFTPVIAAMAVFALLKSIETLPRLGRSRWRATWSLWASTVAFALAFPPVTDLVSCAAIALLTFAAAPAWMESARHLAPVFRRAPSALVAWFNGTPEPPMPRIAAVAPYGAMASVLVGGFATLAVTLAGAPLRLGVMVGIVAAVIALGKVVQTLEANRYRAG